jgi:hypothetical protein
MILYDVLFGVLCGLFRSFRCVFRFIEYIVNTSNFQNMTLLCKFFRGQSAPKLVFLCVHALDNTAFTSR